MTAAGGTKIPTSGYYWSSTEYSSVDALFLYLVNGKVINTNYKSDSYSNYYTRCAVAY